MATLDAIERRVDDVATRMPGAASSSSATIHVSDRGAVVVVVGLLAVCCLIGAAAMAFVSREQARMAQEMSEHNAALMRAQTQELRDRVEMLESESFIRQSRAKKEQKP